MRVIVGLSVATIGMHTDSTLLGVSCVLVVLYLIIKSK
jgi:hypothetical protein